MLLLLIVAYVLHFRITMVVVIIVWLFFLLIDLSGSFLDKQLECFFAWFVICMFTYAFLAKTMLGQTTNYVHYYEYRVC